MALLNINIPSSATDVVGVFDQNFSQVFPMVRPVKALIDESAKPMDHPIEKGTVITDHIIFLQNEIELQTILPAGDYRSAYQQVEQIFRSGQILSVQTRANTYQNMFIYKMPHQEDADLYDTIVLSVRLRQVQIVDTLTQALPATAVKNPVDQSTVNTGLQLPSAPQSLPAPAPIFNAAQPNPGMTLVPGTHGLTPNEQTYSTYEGADLPPSNITIPQAKQILNAAGYSGLGKTP